jgi:hypothetical protein
MKLTGPASRLFETHRRRDRPGNQSWSVLSPSSRDVKPFSESHQTTVLSERVANVFCALPFARRSHRPTCSRRLGDNAFGVPDQSGLCKSPLQRGPITPMQVAADPPDQTPCSLGQPWSFSVRYIRLFNHRALHFSTDVHTSISRSWRRGQLYSMKHAANRYWRLALVCLRNLA